MDGGGQLSALDPHRLLGQTAPQQRDPEGGTGALYTHVDHHTEDMGSTAASVPLVSPYTLHLPWLIIVTHRHDGMTNHTASVGKVKVSLS